MIVIKIMKWCGIIVWFHVATYIHAYVISLNLSDSMTEILTTETREKQTAVPWVFS